MRANFCGGEEMSRERTDDEYDAQNRALMAREERKHERAKDRAEALERNAGKTLSKLLKSQKSKLKKDMIDSVNRADTGQLSDTERAIIDGGRRGDQQIFIDEGVVTGEAEVERFFSFDDDED
jgi:hypothetical protein